MSAFIVGTETIQKVMTAIDSMNRDVHASVYEFNGKRVGTNDELSKLGGLIFNLNVEAVCQRYSDEELKIVPFKFKPTAALKGNALVPHFKALQCLIYQCSEGDVPERPEYKAMEKLAADVAAFIVTTMPEYDAAKWG
jgi:hypothetical protein